MKKMNKNFYIKIMALPLLLIGSDVYSARTNRRSARSIYSATNAQTSTGLKNTTSGIKTIKCAKPGDPACIGKKTTAFLKCGANARKNSAGTACECVDETNYIINASNTNECIKKNDSFAVSQRKACGNALINAIQNACDESYFNNGIGEDGKLKCYDANDLFINFDTSGITVYIEGQAYEYDKACYMFTEDLTKSIADDYQITGANSPNCKLKRVVAEASNECFQAVLSAGRATGAVDSIESKLNSLCGIAGLQAKWTKLFGDEEQKGIIFPTDIPRLYINAGKLSPADGIEVVSNYLDGKITDKSNDWEVKITQILNTHLNEVGPACGSEYAATMHQTDIQVSREKSSLARAIDEQGGLKGAQTWTFNQASVIVGENRMNKLSREGIIGGVKDEDVNTDTSIAVLPLSGDISDKTLKEKKSELKTGKYLLLTPEGSEKKQYRIIEVRKTGVGENATIEYKTIDYDMKNENVNLSKTALKRMLGREENKELNQTEFKTLDD